MNYFSIRFTQYFNIYRNPTPTADAQLGIPTWPRLRPNALVYMDIDKNLTVRKDPKHYVYVREIFEQYLRPPYNVY